MDQPWILPPSGSLARDKLNAMFVQHSLAPPANIVETAALPVIVSLLQQTDMIAAVPEVAVQASCKAGDLRVLVRNLPLRAGAFGLITRRGQQLSSGAQLMLKTLRELGSQLPAANAPGAAVMSTPSRPAAEVRQASYA